MPSARLGHWCTVRLSEELIVVLRGSVSNRYLAGSLQRPEWKPKPFPSDHTLNPSGLPSEAILNNQLLPTPIKRHGRFSSRESFGVVSRVQPHDVTLDSLGSRYTAH